MKSNLITKKTIATAVVLMLLVLCFVVSAAIASTQTVAAAAEAEQQAAELQQARNEQLAQAEEKFKLQQEGKICSPNDIVYDSGETELEHNAEQTVPVASASVESTDVLPTENNSGEYDIMPIANVTQSLLQNALTTSFDQTVAMDADITLTSTLTVTRSITLDLNGYTLTGASGKDVITVTNTNADAITFTLINSGSTGGISGGRYGILANANANIVVTNVTMSGCTSWGIYTNASYECNITISSSSFVSCANGVYITGNASLDRELTMTGCQISGGAIGIQTAVASVTTELANNTISGCTNTGVSAAGTLNMHGNTISGCTQYGVNITGTFNMLSGTISGCGTGVNVNGTCYMTDGIITENTGVGVYVAPGSTFEMNDGIISNNGSYGVHVAGSVTFEVVWNGNTPSIKTTKKTSYFTLIGGSITGNANSGVYLYSLTEFNMSGGTISDNSATNGGGVLCQTVMHARNYSLETGPSGNKYVSASYVIGISTFTMSAGMITGNSAKTNGGGVYLNGATFNFDGGSISGNSATGCGGGVYVIGSVGTYMSNLLYNTGLYKAVCQDSTLVMTNGTIADNTAKYGGGVYLHATVKKYLSNTTSDHIVTYSFGSAVGALDMSGGSIAGNTALYGGGVYQSSYTLETTIARGSIRLSGTAVVKDNGYGSLVENIYLISGITLGTFSSGAEFWITTASTGGFTAGTVSDPTYVNYFHSDDSRKCFTVSGTALVLQPHNFDGDLGLCILCGESSTMPGHGGATSHSLKFIPAVPATCKTVGTKAYYVCTVCGDAYDENRIKISSLGVWLVTPTTKGGGMIEKGSHSQTIMPGLEATCLDNGYKSYWYCSKCNSYFADEACEIAIDNLEQWKQTAGENGGLIPSSGAHQWKYEKQNDGTHRQYCGVCDVSETVACTPKNGDVYTQTATEHYQECSVCGEKITSGSHVYSGFYLEIDDSIHYRDCGVCGYRGDTHTAEQSSWTIADATTHSGPCVTCGNLITRSHIDELVWVNVNGQYHRQECKACGYKSETSVHTWNTWHNADNSDMHARECTAEGCGAKEEHNPDQYLPSSWTNLGEEGHQGVCQYDDCGLSITKTHDLSWKNNEQQHWQECTAGDCDYTIGNGDHKFESTWSQSGGFHFHACEADCGYEENMRGEHVVDIWAPTTTGSHIGYCSVCGNTKAEEPHTLTSFAHNANAHWYECEKCGAKEANMTVHNWEQMEYKLGDGVHYKECEVCGEVNYSGKHTLVKINMVPATCIDYGVKEYHQCLLCKLYVADEDAHEIIGDLKALEIWKASVGRIEMTTHSYAPGIVVCSVCGHLRSSASDDLDGWLDDFWKDMEGRKDAEFEAAKNVDEVSKNAPHVNNSNKYSAARNNEKLSNDATEIVEESREPEEIDADSLADLKYLKEDENKQYKKEYAEAWNKFVRYYKEAHDENLSEVERTIAYNLAAQAIKDWKLVAARWDAVNKVREAAERARQNVENRKPDITDEEAKELEDRITQEEEKTVGDIKDKQTPEEIEDVVDEVLPNDPENPNGKFGDIAGTKSEDIDNEKKKDTAKKELEDKAKELEKDINRRSDLTEEEKSGIIDRIYDELDKAKGEIDNATSSEEIESAKKAGENALEEAELNYTKDQAKKDLEHRGEQAKSEIDKMPDLTDEEKQEAYDEIDKKVEEAQGRIDSAETVDDVKDVVDQVEKELGSIVDEYDELARSRNENPGEDKTPSLKEKKQEARDELDSAAEEKKQEIEDRVANGELDRDVADEIIDRIDSELDKGKGEVDKALNGDEVEHALEDGLKNIEDAELNNAKDKAKKDLDKKAQEARDAIDSSPNLSDEEKEAAKDAIDEALKNAKKAVDDATTLEEVDQAVQDGIGIIVDVVDSVDGELRDAKDKALEDLENAKKEAEEKIKKDPKLTDEEKEKRLGELEKDYEDAKKKIEQAVTPEEAKQAGANGVKNIGEVVSDLNSGAVDGLDIGVAIVSLSAQAVVILAAFFIVRRKRI
ncbi:MAG: DUF1542 domain-containing protein [Clostridiales bacterium]|nr:DUF1542 domain-containing protein [Clostridiales bacterium]